MPSNSAPYCHIDVEFGEFGPVKSLGVDPSTIFDFSSSADFSTANQKIPSVDQETNSFLHVNHSLMSDVLSASNEFRQNSQFVGQPPKISKGKEKQFLLNFGKFA